ncbi:hypothetical protein EGW08_002054 [Elysia chlorotica]|uniref:Ig-like domain-containing protein n=1 Tax=Elysia chlorotica TaxID=188477 RepID=A0A3S1BK98_ELYCH|nr:hypothetical protein EGW08_002054 [Elysia chlorotica]
MRFFLPVLLLSLVSRHPAKCECPTKGSAPILQVTPTERLKVGATLRADCSAHTEDGPQITWSVYRKEWGHLQYTLVPPDQRTIEKLDNKDCADATTSRLTMNVTERLHGATLACFARDTSSQPERCDSQDATCVQSEPIKVFVPSPLTRCWFQFGVTAMLFGGWLLILIPLLIGGIWWATRSLPATAENLLDDDAMVFKLF